MDTRTQYLSLEDALRTARETSRTWQEKGFGKTASAEGWDVFNLPATGGRHEPEAEAFLSAGIERLDDMTDAGGKDADPAFDGDEAAVAHCAEQSAGGSEHHVVAMRLEHALNSIRRHLWGEDWVDSRLGPEAHRPQATRTHRKPA